MCSELYYVCIYGRRSEDEVRMESVELVWTQEDPSYSLSHSTAAQDSVTVIEEQTNTNTSLNTPSATDVEVSHTHTHTHTPYIQLSTNDYLNSI